VKSVLESRFQLAANGTTVRREALAGVTTFLTMAYIIFVQPAVLGAAGMDLGAVLVATCLSTAFATTLMALLANYPIAVAPAMGHNFFFAYTVVLGMKVPWQVALGAVAIAGLIFIVTADYGDSGVAEACDRGGDRPADRHHRPRVGGAHRRSAGNARRPQRSA
jgi:AGZA family xanthine/uracil permease-like MFS transporter